MDKSSMFLRFPIGYRIEHWTLAINFTILAITGLSQMYATAESSQWIVGVLGGIENVRRIHHFCAIVMILETLVHIGVVQYRRYMTLEPSRILPTWGDAINALQAFGYNFGLVKDRPKEGRFTFAEKAEYWALIWGTLIMVISGFMMWNPVATTRYLPGEVIPAAKAAHGLEAVLAVLAIIVWHFYFVLIKKLNMSMFHGYVSREELAHEHPLELIDILEGRVKHIEPADETKRRYWMYQFPLYMLLCFIIMWWSIYFAYFEQTSVESIIAPEQVTVYLPAPDDEVETGRFEGVNTFDVTWNSVVGKIFEDKCIRCHGPDAPNGLDLTTYASAVSSEYIVPGSPELSRLLTVQEEGNHYNSFNTYDLAFVHIWIGHGAPEEVTIQRPELAPSWTSEIAGIFHSACTGCHGTMQMGGLDLTTYVSAVDAGVLVAGDVDASLLMQKIKNGDHNATFSPEELQKLSDWINAGLPEFSEEVEPETVESPEEQAPEETSTVNAHDWETEISGLFSECAGCHGHMAMGGLNLTSYESAKEKASTIVATMEAGDHAALLSADALDTLKAWIANGMPGGGSEVAETPSQEEVSTESPTWDGEINHILSEVCGGCHGANAAGGLDISSWQSIMDSGSIVAGDSSASLLITKVADGTHMSRFTAEHLALVKLWIDNGAPEN